MTADSINAFLLLFFHLKWTWFHLFFPGENLLQGFLVPKSESGLFLQTQISFLQIRTVAGAVPQIPVAGENAKRTRKPFVAHVIGGMVEQSRLANNFPDLSEFIVQNRAVVKDLALSGSQPGAGFKFRQFGTMGTFFPAFPGNGKNFGWRCCRKKLAQQFVDGGCF